METKGINLLWDEISQIWNVTFKDMKVYYLQPGMIMFGFIMPFLMFFSFSVQRGLEASQGIARLLALTVFFTASAAGPFIIPLERRLGTYDRLLASPMSLITLLLGKINVGAMFAVITSVFSLVVGLIVFNIQVASPGLLGAAIVLGAFSFSSLGLIFGSIPTRYPGDVQMPSTILRWGLLFISGVFVPLSEIGAAGRIVAYFSPLTYAQDLMNHAVIGQGLLNPWLDISVLFLAAVLFLVPSIMMHRRSRKLGY
jgi:ABC-2 type transport system permease protein